jgi:hypothetical protein
VRDASRPPDFISVEAHRDHDHPIERWIRWIFVGALVALSVAALVGVFGQRPSTAAAVSPDATLHVKAPEAIRGGLLFQSRLEVVARRPIRRPTLVLSSGWLDNLTINTIVPEPLRARSVDEGVALEYPPLAEGGMLTVYLQFRVDPTTVGRRRQDVALLDGSRELTAVTRTVTVFP